MKASTILQSEASECGLACLAMVAAHYGHRVGLPELRTRFPLSLKAPTLSRLIDVAGALGLHCRALRLELSHLSQLATPCILHWDLNHFVVFAKVQGDRATIHDPASGKRVLRLAQVSKQFTGVAVELSPTATFTKKRAAPAVALRQLTGRVTGLWQALLLLLLLSVTLQVFVVVAPLFMQWVVDQVLVAADRDLLTVLGLGFGLALLLQVVIGLLRAWAVVHLSTRLGLQWQSNVLSHALRLPLCFFEKRHLGDITSRMDSVKAIQKTLATSFVEAVIDGLMAVVTLGLMLRYSWKLALVTLAAVVIYLGIRGLAYRLVRDGTECQLGAAAKQQSHLLESIRGIQSIKVAGSEPARMSNYLNLLHDTVNREVLLAKLNLGLASASQLIFGLERIVVVWVGAVLALSNVFSVGMLVAYLAYKDQFAQRVAALIDKWVEFRMLRLHSERLADIVLSDTEATEPPDGAPPRPGTADLEVSGLGFRYAAGEPWILKDCNFTIRPGEAVAIVGPSGCGKTTLVKLLLGLLLPTEGEIRVGATEMTRLGLRNYRHQVGAVMQDDQLFAGSIADNIAFEGDGYDLQRMEASARLAAVHDDVIAMPMGYQSLIGDMGAALSGGQKQRILLARALYREPRYLFLDEATSHLDVERERLVNEAIRSLDITRVIIAHRPETIASADRVLVLQGGRIVQELQKPQASSPAAVETA